MSDQRIIDEAVALHEMGKPVDDLQAKVIASAWHSGQSSALYSFSSTGAISEDLEWEITRQLDSGAPFEQGERPELDALRAYVVAQGWREPQPNWSDLSW